MRNLPVPLQTHLSARTGLDAHLLIWIEPLNTANVRVPVGFWTGADSRQFTIGGAQRTYGGAGSVLTVDPLESEVGISVRRHTITLSGVDALIKASLSDHNARLAPIDLHVAYFDPLTAVLIAAPQRIFKGFVDAVTFDTEPKGGASSCAIDILSAAFSLTLPLHDKKSHADLLKRAATDGFRRYSDLAGMIETPWGEERATGIAPAPAAAVPSSHNKWDSLSR